MTALTDLQNLREVDNDLSYNEIEAILNITRKVIKSANHIQIIYKLLDDIATSGQINNIPTDLKAELNFFYQQVTALKNTMTARTAFMELYHTIYPNT